MDVQSSASEVNLLEVIKSLPDQSIKTASHSASPLGSDSDEESGYMSCASTEPKTNYAKDTENLFADIRNHIDSSKSDGSLNDLSSCDQNDSSHDHDDAEECQTVQHVGMAPFEEENKADAKSTENNESEDESSIEEETDEEGDAAQDEASDKGENESSDEEEEESIKKLVHNRNYTRQTTVVERQDNTDQETSSEEEEEEEEGEEEEESVTVPEVKYTKVVPERSQSSESEGTWISEEGDKCKGVDGAGDDSDGPDIGDFFDGLTDNISYTFQEDDNDNVYTYPHKDFLYDRSSPVFGPTNNVDNGDDDDEDFAYLYSSNLNTGKRYAFPRREPRTISDAVDFWETDFEVKGAIYPRMSAWEVKGLAPTYEEDVEDFGKFNMYKVLYEKWVKCNRSQEQWSQRYWGRSLEAVAQMKGPEKGGMVTSQSDSAIYVTGVAPSSLRVVNDSVADRRRRRRNDAISSSRGSTMCY